MTHEEYEANLDARLQCEDAILEHLKEIVQLVHQYAPDCNYLSMSYVGDSVFFNNSHWSDDADYPLDRYIVLSEEEQNNGKA